MRNPYVTGPYVSGRKHYGRQNLLDALLYGEANAYWVIGSRRIGKTSLLRQLETMALTGPHRDRYLPIFWDMQGCNTIASLGSYLVDALQERFDLAQQFGVSREIARDENVLTLLPALRRAMRDVGRELLLLCDETEVLIHIARAEPELAQRLHAELTRGGGLRVVAVSTRRIYELHEVCRSWPTSPFLAGFDMSYTLGCLSRADAQALATQAQSDEPVQAAAEVVETICDLTNGHPYLVQLLCSRVFRPEEGALRPIEPADLTVDPLLGGFLNNDFGLLTPGEQRLVWAVHERGAVEAETLAGALDREPVALQASLQELAALGYLRRSGDRWEIGNRFLTEWLAAERRRSDWGDAGLTSRGTDEPTPLVAAPTLPDEPPVRPAGALVEQLNNRRDRLVELELVRARALTNVSPAVLAEIRQVEQEIAELRRRLGMAA